MAKIPENLSSYGNNYSDSDLLGKVSKVAGKAGKEVIKHVLTLYYLLKSGNVPFMHKAEIVGALGYFILPLDLIPDVIIGLGYTDDLAGLVYVYNKVRSSVTPDVERNVNTKLRSIGL